MSRISSLESAIHSIEHSKNKKTKRAAYKRLVDGAIPALVQAKYRTIKSKKGSIIRSHNASRISKIKSAESVVNSNLAGKAGLAAGRATSRLSSGNLTQGINSL